MMLVLSLLACSGGGFDAQPMAPATVLEPYHARIGEGRRDHGFELIAGELPEGVFLHEDGVITGTPQEGGLFEFTVGYRDERLDLQLDVGWPDDVLACGRSVQVHIDAFNPAALNGDHATWEPAESWAMLRVPPPAHDVHRMTVRSEPSGLWPYWAMLGATVGEGTIDTDLWHYGHDVDDFTEPDVDTWSAIGEPVTLGLVGWSIGEFTVELDCGYGPGFDEEGEMLIQGEYGVANWNTVDSEFGMTFTYEGDLPDGLEFDPDWARFRGTPSEPGVYPIAITADDGETPANRHETAIRVQYRDDVACGGTAQVQTEQSWGDATSDGWYGAEDPREYRIFELELPEGVSRIDVAWDAGTVSGGFFDVLDPTPATWSAFPGYFETDDGTAGAVSLTPLFNDIRSYTHDGRALVFGQGAGELQVECSVAPRLGDTLPVIHPDGGSWSLEGYGGFPPYTWSAQGLPDGVELLVDGTLTGVGVVEGSATVQIDLVDSEGGASGESFELFIGEHAACGSTPVLECGDSISGVYSGYSPLFCFVPRPGQSLRFDNQAGTGWNYLSGDDFFVWAEAGEVVEVDALGGEYAQFVFTSWDEPYDVERVCP